MRKSKTGSKIVKAVVLVVFFAYMAALVYFLFFSEKYGRNAGEDYRYNLIPFSEIKRFFKYSDVVGTEAFLVNIVGNIVAFIPFGILLPIVIKGYKKSAIIIFDGFVVSLIIETIQLFTKVGSFDVDDIILNTIGVAIGYVLFKVVYKRYKRR